jgi:hypothetical protein
MNGVNPWTEMELALGQNAALTLPPVILREVLEEHARLVCAKNTLVRENWQLAVRVRSLSALLRLPTRPEV